MSEAEESEQPELDGWPSVSLAAAGLREVTYEELFDLVLHDNADAGAYSLVTAPGGTAEARVVPHLRSRHKECQTLLRECLRSSTFQWKPERLVLLNEPCYIAVATGAILLANGRIVLDTLFPTGHQSIELCVGGGLTAENLAAEMRKAPEFKEGVWAPLFSYGSTVYGHAVAESLVQDSVLQRLGFSPWITYAATDWPEVAQEIVIAQAHSPVRKFPSLLVKVPRVMFASKLYRHEPIGNEFRQLIARIKTRLLFHPDLGEPAGDKIYVPRLGFSSRRLSNEVQLIERLTKLGFRVVSGERMSFEEQVCAFRGARVIVGPYGSGLTNSAFASANATLCELRSLNNPDHSPNRDDFYFALAASMQYSYALYVAENPAGAGAWKCNIPDVLEMIDAATKDAVEHERENAAQRGA